VSGETAAWLLNDVDELSAIYDKVQSLTRFAGLVLLASFCWPLHAPGPHVPQRFPPLRPHGRQKCGARGLAGGGSSNTQPQKPSPILLSRL